MIFLTRNFAINNIYLYDRKAFIKKNTVFNKIVLDFMGHSVYKERIETSGPELWNL